MELAKLIAPSGPWGKAKKNTAKNTEGPGGWRRIKYLSKEAKVSLLRCNFFKSVVTVIKSFLLLSQVVFVAQKFELRCIFLLM